MKLTAKHLRDTQVQLFFDQFAALKREEDELNEHFNIARNLACSEWEYGLVPTNGGGITGLRVARMVPDKLDLLRKNFDQQRSEISYRRYALIKVYMPIIKERVKELNNMGEYGQLNEIVEYWDKQKEIA